ncbi:rCG44607 [Rattus norvegicus]|uniref:RCG44607 n=1 Tax=Rattus norvegicus TaxID=10116 RepID=A6I5G1_RAT|nr:rCG44607 [Rattus norvegicus]
MNSTGKGSIFQSGYSLVCFSSQESRRSQQAIQSFGNVLPSAKVD